MSDSSVIDAVMARFPAETHGRLKAYMACGIAPEHFKHPIDGTERGRHNERMSRHLVTRYGRRSIEGACIEGKISLKGIISLQLGKYGVRSSNIGWDCIDTYGDGGPDSYRWNSHRRANDFGLGDVEAAKRNAVIVINPKR